MEKLKHTWLIKIILPFGIGRKSFFWIMVFCVSGLSSHSQLSIGLQGGVSDNRINTNVSNLASTVIEWRTGYSIGLVARYRIASHLFVDALPTILQKNYSVNRTDSLSGIYTRYNNTYLQLAILPHFEYGQRMKIFGNAGAYLGYWICGETEGKIPDIFSVSSTGILQQTEIFQLTSFHQKYSFNKKRDNRIEFGCVAGGGMGYELKKNILFTIECLYYRAITDQQKNYMIYKIPQHNQTFIFSTGILYNLK